MQRFDILDPELNIFQNTFLEASAGTGKTFAIEHLVIRLLLESKEPIQLKEILAVTFTKDAAHEMKARIRKKLESLLPGNNPRVRQALANFDEIQVFTIHAFCHRMLTEFAFEARTPFQMNSPENLQEIRQVVIDFLRTGDKRFQTEISDLMKRCRYDLDQFVNRVLSSDSSEIGKECRERWRIKASRSDHFTFDDLLNKMETALDIPAFLDKVRAKYQAVIVDEFQDTDPVQWRIFEKLFLDTHLIYLVGDPKQSIYRFRNADIYTYMRAAEVLGADKKAYLDTNFRSTPQLIDRLNALFSEKSNWVSLHYHPVKAGRSEAKLTEEPIYYFGARGKQGRERSWPTKQMEEEKLFPFIGSEIIRLHKEHEIPFAQMAILIKDRFQAKRVQKHLNQWKIPSSIKQTFNLTESRGFAAMEALLKATAHPENESLVRAVLYGPLMQISENPFFVLKQLFEEKGFAALFAEFMQRYFSADTSLYLELRQTAEILMEQGKVSLAEHLHLMEELRHASPESDERLKLRGEEGEDRVPIMTTFASKGLEFDVVFALGMASRHQSEEVDSEQEAEKMRQLYVAFTRSREKLYIPILYDEAQKPVTNGSPIELFFAGTDLPVQWIDKIEIEPYNEEKAAVQLIPPPKPQIHFEPEYLTSFTAMSNPQSHAPLPFDSQDFSSKNPHTLPIGAETGVVLHTLFETHFQDRSVPLAQVVLETLNGTHLEGWEEVIETMIHDTLKMPLIGDFCLDMLEEGDYYQEMEFLFPQKNQLVKGFIDLVFVKEDRFYIVDWKTNWLGPSEESYTDEKLHATMIEHDYYLQAKLYREALERYVKQLYFGGSFYIFLRGKKGVFCGDS
ncbi:MAG: UvrD-helicase domain-containing protein [Verrucomicrobia bacterium]|nr:UvrD-helicase domain-containing protein [Verrucomicrobiota bacterium]